jgi:hypothetical protein
MKVEGTQNAKAADTLTETFFGLATKSGILRLAIQNVHILPSVHEHNLFYNRPLSAQVKTGSFL